MKILIVDDDFVCRNLLQEILKDYGSTHIATDGKEAVAAVRAAIDSGEPYNLICLDILMPEMDGQQALQQIRDMEEAAGFTASRGTMILMITSLGDLKNLQASFDRHCDGYVIKPFTSAEVLDNLRRLKLIK